MRHHALRQLLRQPLSAGLDFLAATPGSRAGLLLPAAQQALPPSFVPDAAKSHSGEQQRDEGRNGVSKSKSWLVPSQTPSVAATQNLDLLTRQQSTHGASSPVLPFAASGLTSEATSSPALSTGGLIPRAYSSPALTSQASSPPASSPAANRPKKTRPARKQSLAQPVSDFGGFEELFEIGRKDGENVAVGRAWEAWELRHKSFNDLHALWYVLTKERTRLYSQKQMMQSQRQKMPQPHRIALVKKSMCRIKQVLTERALAVEDEGKRWFYKQIINRM